MTYSQYPYNKPTKPRNSNQLMQNPNYNNQRTNGKKELYYIFTYYCSFADRDNYQSLKIQNFRRLLTDAQLVSSNNQNIQMQMDLLFAKLTKNTNGIDFSMFLIMVVEIAKLLFGEHNQEQGARKLMSENFHALYQFIFENTQFGQSIRNLTKTSYSQSCFILLKSLSPTLYRIYLHYFDINSVKVLKEPTQIFKRLSNFTKNFQITPQLLTKSQSFIIFNYVLDQDGESAYKQWFEVDKQNKHTFTYFDFIRFVFIISLTVNKKAFGVEVSQLQKMVYFLEMLEVSNGFIKLCKSQHIKLHLLPDKKLVKQLEAKNDSFGISPINLSPAKKISNGNDGATLNQRLMQNYSELRQKFISFCLHGETIGDSFLSHKKVINILLDMKLGLKQPEIEVYLASSKKPLQFETFMHLLQKISEKEMIQLEQIIQIFKNLQLSEEIEHSRLRMSRSNINLTKKQYRNCIAIIEIVQQLLKLAFMSQCEPSSKGQGSRQELKFISLSSYLKIIHDFQLSPNYITKQSLIDIFRQSIKKSYDFMIFPEFKDSFIIAIPYLIIGQSETQPQTKLIVIFQRINQSRGISRLYKKMGAPQKEDHLVKLRQIFKQYYMDAPKPDNSFAKIQQIFQ